MPIREQWFSGLTAPIIGDSCCELGDTTNSLIHNPPVKAEIGSHGGVEADDEAGFIHI